MLTEDLGILDIGEDEVNIHPSLPYFRLWQNSFELINEQSIQENRICEHQQKFYQAIAADNYCKQPLRLQNIYFLDEPEQGNQISITPMGGVTAINALNNARFFGVIREDEEKTKKIFNETLTLSRYIRCFKLVRPKKHALAEQVVDKLIAHWQLLNIIPDSSFLT